MVTRARRQVFHIRPHALNYLLIVLLVRFDWQKLLASLLLNPLESKAHVCFWTER